MKTEHHTFRSASAALLILLPWRRLRRRTALRRRSEGLRPASGCKIADGKAPDGKPTGSEPLSDKLARTDGVICPPNVDPEIKAPTPESGNKMPVIPPPGGPGGDPSVRPK